MFFCPYVITLLLLPIVRKLFVLEIRSAVGKKPAVSVLPGDLTLVDVQASLGHVAHAPLRLLGDKCVEVMHVWRLVSDLKVTDAAVTLTTKKKNKETKQ